ncbi:unnamed protein product [Linum tenue]|uniref:Uncharacterized protein n=1 Tax=Linum tenue TaxID=586396 RepID=A0AAV0RUU2_9ROSI|nr:unnamed protein product [Linum tenue]
MVTCFPFSAKKLGVIVAFFVGAAVIMGCAAHLSYVKERMRQKQGYGN